MIGAATYGAPTRAAAAEQSRLEDTSTCKARRSTGSARRTMTTALMMATVALAADVEVTPAHRRWTLTAHVAAGTLALTAIAMPTTLLYATSEPAGLQRAGSDLLA